MLKTSKIFWSLQARTCVYAYRTLRACIESRLSVNYCVRYKNASFNHTQRWRYKLDRSYVLLHTIVHVGRPRFCRYSVHISMECRSLFIGRMWNLTYRSIISRVSAVHRRYIDGISVVYRRVGEVWPE